jgi:hypothetical protein
MVRVDQHSFFTFLEGACVRAPTTMVVGLKFQFNDALLDQTLFLMEHSDAPQGLTVTVSHIDTQDKGGIVEFRY